MEIFFALMNSKLKDVYSIELCEQYDYNYQLNTSFYCLKYCCGSCNFNYCCSSESYSVDYLHCRELAAFRKQTPYAKIKPEALSKNRTNGIEYSGDIYIEACGAFRNSHGLMLQPKRCPRTSKLCCGSCDNRYCCNSTMSRLNQFECKLATEPPASTTTNSYSAIFVLLILGLILMLAFLCIPFVIFINKRSKKPDNSLMQFQNLRPSNQLRTELPILDTVLDDPKVDYKEENLPPPPYASLHFNGSQDLPEYL